MNRDHDVVSMGVDMTADYVCGATALVGHHRDVWATVVASQRIPSTKPSRLLAVQRLRVVSFDAYSSLISSTSSSDYCSVGHRGGRTVQGGAVYAFVKLMMQTA